MSFRRQTAIEGPRKAFAVVDALGNKYFGTSFAALLLSGIGLVLISDYGFGSIFVVIGIAVLVVQSVLEGAVLGPTTKRLVEADDAAAVKNSPVLRWGTALTLALLVVVVWAMVAKPGV